MHILREFKEKIQDFERLRVSYILFHIYNINIMYTVFWKLINPVKMMREINQRIEMTAGGHDIQNNTHIDSSSYCLFEYNQI